MLVSRALNRLAFSTITHIRGSKSLVTQDPILKTTTMLY